MIYFESERRVRIHCAPTPPLRPESRRATRRRAAPVRGAYAAPLGPRSPLTPAGRARLRYLQQNHHRSICTIKRLEPMQARPPEVRRGPAPGNQPVGCAFIAHHSAGMPRASPCEIAHPAEGSQARVGMSPGRLAKIVIPPPTIARVQLTNQPLPLQRPDPVSFAARLHRCHHGNRRRSRGEIRYLGHQRDPANIAAV